ncbi:MAG: enoyl-CoA hydratase/isomerase family protein, partial [Nevskiales bacterium]
MLDRIEHTNGILELRMNRPPVNAMDPALVQQLRTTVAQAPRDGARALILSGREGLYTGGLDVPALLALDAKQLQAFFREFFTMLRTVAASEIPIAAAITGHSPAGGAVLSCFCDWRVMAQGNYRFGFNEVAVGIIVPTSVRRAITRMAGAEVSERMSVEARLISPEDALRLNLVHELAPPAEVVPRARAWCERILAQPARATITMRRLAREDLIAGFEGLEQDAELFTDLWYG